MYVLKIGMCHGREANCHARHSRSKELLKDIHPMTSASFYVLTKIFTVAELKTPQNH